MVIYTNPMSIECIDGSSSASTYDPKRERAIIVETVSINPETLRGKRPDDHEWFQLSRSEFRLLRILCVDSWISVKDIAAQYELSSELNKIVFALNNREKKDLQSKKDIKEEILAALDKLDENYGDDPQALGTSIDHIRVLISNLRKKIGFRAIESKKGFGRYRLAKLPENNSSSDQTENI